MLSSFIELLELSKLAILKFINLMRMSRVYCFVLYSLSQQQRPNTRIFFVITKVHFISRLSTAEIIGSTHAQTVFKLTNTTDRTQPKSLLWLPEDAM